MNAEMAWMVAIFWMGRKPRCEVWPLPLPRSRRALRAPGAGARSDAEIDFLHLFVLFQIDRLAFEHGAAGLQHIGIIGDVERERDRLLGEQQRQSLLVQ